MEGLKAADVANVGRQASERWMPEQKITLDEAIRAFTVGSAYAEFQDGVKGSIAPGKLADLVLLDRNIYTIDPASLDQVTGNDACGRASGL
jgi:predicted amidohydrolase YtcJ